MCFLNLAAITVISASLVTACAFTQRVMPGTMSHANILSLFSTIDKNEIEGAQLARQKASSPLIRNYAERLVREHTASLAKKATLAEEMHLQLKNPSLASELERAYRDTLEALRNTSGPDFDRAYLDHQMRMHNQATNMAQTTAESVDDARLRQQLFELHSDFAAHAGKARSIHQQLAGRAPIPPHL